VAFSSVLVAHFCAVELKTSNRLRLATLKSSLVAFHHLFSCTYDARSASLSGCFSASFVPSCPSFHFCESKRPRFFPPLPLIASESSLALTFTLYSQSCCYIGIHLTFPEVELNEYLVSRSVVSSSVRAPYGVSCGSAWQSRHYPSLPV
jgi:hypothetical protein